MRAALFLFIFFTTEALSNNYILFQDNGKVGMKNSQGVVILPPEFDALGWSDGSFSVESQVTGYKRNGMWGLITTKKEFITKAEFSSLLYAEVDKAIATKSISPISIKTGCINFSGAIVIPFQYDAIKITNMRAIVMNKSGADYLFGVIDLSNKVIIPVAYQNIYPVSFLRFAVENKQGKQALFTADGKQVSDFTIDSISSFRKNYAIIYSNGLQGLINRDGEVVTQPQFNTIKHQDDGSITALQPDAWKVLDGSNQVLNTLIADDLSPYFNDCYLITHAGKQGIINKKLETVWAAEYDLIGKLINEHVPVKRDGNWGLMHWNRTYIIPNRYDSISWDGEVALLFSMDIKPKWTLQSVKMKSESKGYESMEKVSENYYKVSKNNFYGLISSTGKELVHCVYDSIQELKGDLLAVKFKNLYGIVSSREEWILAPQPNHVTLVNQDLYIERIGKVNYLKDFKGNLIYFTEGTLTDNTEFLKEINQGIVKKISLEGVEIKNEATTHQDQRATSGMTVRDLSNEGLTLIYRQGKFGFVDNRGRLIIPNRYDSAKAFSNGMAPFKLIGKWGYLDTEDKIMVNPTYDFAGDFENGYAVVKKNGKYGLIDRTGTIKLSIAYTSITKQNNRLVISIEGKIGLAQHDGKILIEPRYDSLAELPNKQVLVSLHGFFGVLSFDGLNIIPIVYKSLEFDADKNVFLGHQESSWITIQH